VIAPFCIRSKESIDNDRRPARFLLTGSANILTLRDVREIVAVEKLEQVPRLLRVLAHTSAQLTNFTQIGGQLGLDDKTTRTYLGILEPLFLVKRVEPWFAERIAANRSIFGPLLENVRHVRANETGGLANQPSSGFTASSASTTAFAERIGWRLQTASNSHTTAGGKYGGTAL
jgi:hypothetical protein